MHVFTVAVVAVVWASLASLSKSESVKFKGCFANNTVTSVDISPCTEQPCQFRKGQNVTVTICFTAPTSSHNVTAEIYGIVEGIPVQFPMPDAAGCRNAGIECPITQGSKYCYKHTMAVLQQYPQIRLVVRWLLRGDEGTLLFCVEFPIEITNARPVPKIIHKTPRKRILCKDCN